MAGAEDEDLAELRGRLDASWVEMIRGVRFMVGAMARAGETPDQIRSKVAEWGRGLAAYSDDPEAHEAFMARVRRDVEEALAEAFADPGPAPADVPPSRVAAPDEGGLFGQGIEGAYQQALPFVAGLARAYMHAPAEKRAEYLEGLRVTARALLRFAMEVGPVVSPGLGRDAVCGRLSREFLGRLELAASLAGLDAFQAETLVGVVQRGFAEATETCPPV